MKKNKGFTLIELLATIAILGVIVSITIIVATSIISRSREKGYKVTINNVERIAIDYLTEYKRDSVWFPVDGKDDKEKYCISVQDLMDTGYFNNDILSSKIADDRNVKSEDYIYIERNKNTKAVEVSNLLTDDTLINSLCDIANLVSSVNIAASPNGWSNKKTITITYRLFNNSKDYSNYDYRYFYSASEISRKKFTGNVMVDSFEITSPVLITGQILEGEKAISTEIYQVKNMDTVNPSIIVKVDNNNYAKSHTVTFKLEDKASGIKDGNYKVNYIVSDMVDVFPELKDSFILNGSNNKELVISKNLTGEKVLYWCLENDVYDNAGNKLLNKCGSVGLKLDNTGPEITISPNGGEYEIGNFLYSTVKLKDNASGLESMDYKWNIGNAQNFIGMNKMSFNQGEKTNTISLNYTHSDEVGKFYLLIMAYDKAGNISSKVSEVFILSKTYNIDYELNGGKPSLLRIGMPNKYKYGVGAVINGVPTKEGYSFMGWASNPVCSDVTLVKVIDRSTSGNKTFYACFDEIKPEEYDISYYDGDKKYEDLDPKTYFTGNVIYLPIVSKDNVNFKGWCMSSNFNECINSSLKNKIEENESGDRKFYAFWDINDFMYNDCNIYYITYCMGNICQYTYKNTSAEVGTISFDKLSLNGKKECKKNYCMPVIFSNENDNFNNNILHFIAVDYETADKKGLHVISKVCELKGGTLGIDTGIGTYKTQTEGGYNPNDAVGKAEDGKCNIVKNDGDEHNGEIYGGYVDYSGLEKNQFCRIFFHYRANVGVDMSSANRDIYDTIKWETTNCSGYKNDNNGFTESDRYYCTLSNLKSGNKYLSIQKQCENAKYCVRGE